MSVPRHPTEQLVDLLDERLGAAEAAEVREHVGACAVCRLEFDRLAAGRAAARSARATDPAPDDLRARVMAALDDVDRAAAPPRQRPIQWVLWVGVAAAAALVLYVEGPWRPLSPDLVGRALAEYEAVRSGSIELELRTADPMALERYFNQASRGPRIRVIDLAMMGWTLEAGGRHRFGDGTGALYAYRSSTGARLVCQMYVGILAELPAASEVRRENGFEFRIYTRAGVTLVFWQEGELVCVLAADLPAAEVVALAVAKAMAAT